MAPPSRFMAVFQSSNKSSFSLNGRLLTPTLLNGTVIIKITFFAASLRFFFENSVIQSFTHPPLNGTAIEKYFFCGFSLSGLERLTPFRDKITRKHMCHVFRYNQINIAVFFCYLVKIDATVSSLLYSSVHWTSHVLQGARNTRPCITVMKLDWSSLKDNTFSQSTPPEPMHVS